jgi:glycosyltransferase involved in cell wall biosynthesis
MGELVSILIPAYNAERWIRDTIRSAVDQTWPHKEIIVVDDGSRDQTLSIARQFASKEVSVVTQANQGSASARNHAFSICQGDYIQWLDADDLLAPDKIARQLGFAESGRESRVLLTSSFGRFYVCHERASIEPTSLWQDLSPADWLINKFNDNVWMNPAAWLVSRKLSVLAGSWDERLSLDDDGEYGCRLVAASKMVRFIGGAMSYYRIGNIGSLSTRVSDKAHESLLLSITLCIQYLMSLEKSERSKKASLNVLQTYLPLFYPEKVEELARMNKLASQMGGTLKAPTINWKHYPFDKILGQAGRIKVVNNWRNLKNLGQKNWEKLAYRCFGPTPHPPFLQKHGS